MRHGLAVLALIALLVPLAPSPGTTMACCRGGGDVCACPLEPGFAKCQAVQGLTVPLLPLALVPVPPASFALAPSSEAPDVIVQTPAPPARSPLVPPPRA